MASPRSTEALSGSLSSLHDNGRSVETRRQPKRRWKPATEYDRSMRAYEQNPRALRGQLDFFGGEAP